MAAAARTKRLNADLNMPVPSLRRRLSEAGLFSSFSLGTLVSKGNIKLDGGSRGFSRSAPLHPSKGEGEDSARLAKGADGLRV
jgi:hypothetical protein